MITGEEHLPMTLMERITDEPCDPMKYLDYAIAEITGRRDYWRAKAKDGRFWDVDADPVVACVQANLDWTLHFLEDAKMKFSRLPLADVAPQEPPQ